MESLSYLCNTHSKLTSLNFFVKIYQIHNYALTFQCESEQSGSKIKDRTLSSLQNLYTLKEEKECWYQMMLTFK